MERLEVLERLAALSADLTPVRGVPAEHLDELRQLLARELIETRVISHSAGFAPARLDLTGFSPDVRAALERAIDVAPVPDPDKHDEPTTGVRVARRTLPFLTSLEADAQPEWAGGRAVSRSLGPFRDRDGRLVWYDIFVPVRQVSIVRAPGTAPFLLLPLRGFSIGPATDYIVPAGSVWMLSHLFAGAAPAGGYCGVRIKGGRLHLSSAPTVSGTTLTINAGVRGTLELELDPPAPAAPAASPGKDAIASTVALPAHVTFVFASTGGALRAADEAKLKAFGAGFSLERKASAATYDASLNRVLFPFTPTPDDFAVSSSQSALVKVSGNAPVTRAAWGLAVAVAPPAQLGAAAGAGALALFTDPGIKADWRGRKGPLVELGRTALVAEPGRLTLVALAAKGPGSTEALRLWKTDGPNAEVRLRFDKTTFRYESLSGQLDVVLTTPALEAAADRPVPVNGRRFPLRAASSLTFFWDDGTNSNVLIEAPLVPPRGVDRTAIALRNALLTVTPPTILLLSGQRATADDEQLQSGAMALVFGVQRFMFTLPDPYVTNQELPQRGDFDRSSTQSSLILLSLVTWPTPATPALTFLLLVPSAAGARSNVSFVAATDVHVEARLEPDQPANVRMFSLAVPIGAGPTHDPPPDPRLTGPEDQQALQQLRGVFERSAGRAQEGLALVDVSTNIDQLGVSWGFFVRDSREAQPFPLQIKGLDVISPGSHSRLFLLPQFQWEPLRNLPNPNIQFFYPDRLASGDDGGATIFGSNTVTLVPVTPDAVLDNLVTEFHHGLRSQPVGARFTLPFGIVAAAELSPGRPFASRWQNITIIRPTTPKLAGGYQISVTAHAHVVGPTVESPSLPGAAWQLRNGVDPITGAPNGFSVLRGDLLNEGVEKFFNEELNPGSTTARVPVTRVDFAGYGATTFSQWFNPSAFAQLSQVRFDTFVGRTAYEVVQVSSILYPWVVPVVRTITIERKRDALVCRSDSGWVATAPGLYRYPAVNPASVPIETHPGVIRGAFNVRRIRETGRVISRTFGAELVELLEVRYDADMQIDGVVAGQLQNTSLVPSIDQVGYVQRSPKGFPLTPAELAAIIADEGAMGGPVNCEIEIAGSGQHMHVVRVDVDAAQPNPAGIPEFAAAVRGSLALPHDGASWSVARRQTSADEFEPVDPIAGTPLIRQGRASAPGSESQFCRIADPRDLLVENTPSLEFGLLQSSDGHQFLLPRPRIKLGATAITSTEVALLADAYARSVSAGLFPRKSGCFTGPAGGELQIVAGGKYRLGPATTAAFTNIAGGEREIIGGSALGIRAKYTGPIKYTLDPALAKAWSVAADAVTTSLDLGPFKDLMGVKHNYRIDAGEIAKLLNPEEVWAPFLDPVVDIIKFLSKLLGIDNVFEVLAVQGSYKFQATAQYPIEGPGNDYIDFGGMKIKGKLQAGFGWSEKDHWFGFFGVELAMKIIVLPPIFANGKTAINLKGTELAGRELKIRVMWGASVEAKLGPIGVSAEFNYGIEVISSESGAWQIGLLVQIVGKADVFIVKVSIKLELMAAIARLPAPDDKVQAIGQAKFAGEVEICWFLTISFSYEIEYKEDLDI